MQFYAMWAEQEDVARRDHTPVQLHERIAGQAEVAARGGEPEVGLPLLSLH